MTLFLLIRYCTTNLNDEPDVRLFETTLRLIAISGQIHSFAHKIHKNRRQLWVCSRPHLRSLQRSPDPTEMVSWEGERRKGKEQEKNNRRRQGREKRKTGE